MLLNLGPLAKPLQDPSLRHLLSSVLDNEVLGLGTERWPGMLHRLISGFGVCLWEYEGGWGMCISGPTSSYLQYSVVMPSLSYWTVHVCVSHVGDLFLPSLRKVVVTFLSSVISALVIHIFVTFRLLYCSALCLGVAAF